jgi:hypothetical protein
VRACVRACAFVGVVGDFESLNVRQVPIYSFDNVSFEYILRHPVTITN